MKKRLALLGAILLATMLVVQPASLAGAQTVPPAAGGNNLISPQGLLNPDGSLHLDSNFSGSLDLKGWDVKLDPQRGPVFSPRQHSVLPIVLQLWGWFGLGSNGVGNGSLNGQVEAIAISGSTVYVGGNFTNVNNNGTLLPTADYIAKWDGSNWSALGSNGAGNGSLNDVVQAIAISGSNVYAGGQFIDVNNNGTLLGAADYLAKWDGTNWSALGYGAKTNTGALSNYVYALAVSGSNVYVGGWFANVNNKGIVLPAADYLAGWDGSNWSALGNNGAGNGSLNGHVDAFAVSGSNLYVGGQFTNVNNNGTVLPTADYIAKWDGTNWSALGSNGAGNGSFNNGILALAVSGSNVYAGGFFTDVNNNGTLLGAADHLAKWDGTNWSALGSNGAGDGSLNDIVDSIAVSGSNVYAGGWFTNVNNKGTLLPTADYIAIWNGTNWSALGGGNGAGNGSLNGPVGAIAVSGSNVYTGGQFTDINTGGTVHGGADYIARYANPTFNYTSVGANDGWVLESGETTSLGGSMNVAGTTFNLGDDAGNRQYRAILHFDTSSLPDNATIISATLKIKKSAVVGTDPFPTFQGLLVDISKTPFSGSNALQLTDFQAAASKNAVGKFGNTAVSSWYSVALSSSAFPYINMTAATEFRLRFQMDDNNNSIADYVKFYSGDSGTAANQPVLVITFELP